MNVRLFCVERDYKDVSEWWVARRWNPVPVDHLPASGLMVEDDNHKYCAGWLYMSGTKFGWFEWLVANPSAPLKKKKMAMELLVSEIMTRAKAAGISSIFSSSNNKNVIKLYESKGFVCTDRDVTHLIARLA
jgi:N-acetylglutamate synthase-like GNAT family acetyltransferase